MLSASSGVMSPFEELLANLIHEGVRVRAGVDDLVPQEERALGLAVDARVLHARREAHAAPYSRRGGRGGVGGELEAKRVQLVGGRVVRLDVPLEARARRGECPIGSGASA